MDSSWSSVADVNTLDLGISGQTLVFPLLLRGRAL
jgi:hypothetical protein